MKQLGDPDECQVIGILIGFLGIGLGHDPQMPGLVMGRGLDHVRQDTVHE